MPVLRQRRPIDRGARLRRLATEARIQGPGVRELIEDADLENRILQEGNPFNKRLRIVCEDCNGGWMGALETAVKSLLIEMFNGTGQVRLDEGAQLTLARWAFKTVAVLTQLGSIKTFPLAHCRELYGSGQPPASSHIWIGSASINVNALGQQLAESRYEPKMAKVTIGERTVEVFCYSARFRLINVVFDVFGYVPTEGFSLHADLPPDLRRALLPIWPSEAPTILWPSETNLDAIGGIQGLANIPLVGVPSVIQGPTRAS